MHATLLHIGGDSSRVVGSALCNYAAKVKATVLVTMKESKSAVQVSPRHIPSASSDKQMHRLQQFLGIAPGRKNLIGCDALS